MTRVVYSRRALRDLDRLADFLIEKDPEVADEAIGAIADGIEVLERHPLIGRPLRASVRELVISFGRTGDVALYRVSRDRVDVLSVRHQREAGF